MVFALLGIPLILIGVAAIAAFVSVGRSYLALSNEAIEIRNYPQPPRVVPIADADHFEPTPGAGYMQFVRPNTACLVLKDGTRIPVRRPRVPADVLNQHLDALRE